MSQLSRSAQWYIAAVAAASVTFLVYFSVYPVVRNFNLLAFIFFLIFTLMAELYPIQLPGENAFTTAGIFYYAILLLFGTTPTLWIILSARALSEIWQGRSWYRVVFNEAQVLLTFSLAGICYQALSHGELSLRKLPDLGALVLSAAIVFSCNSLLLSGVVSLTQRTNFIKVMATQREGIVSHFLVTFPVGIMVAFIYLEEPLAVLVLVVPFFIVHYAFRARSTKVELDRKIQELSLLFEASHYLGTSLSLKRALQVLLDVTQRIIVCDRVHVFLFELSGEKSRLSLKATSYTQVNTRPLIWEYTDEVMKLLPREGNGVLIHDSVGSRWSYLSVWTPEQRRIIEQLYKGEQAAMNVQLRYGEYLLGFVEVTSRIAGAFTEEDLKLLGTLASVAAVAIKNASLYEDTLDLAAKDGLTGLYNHRLFQEFLEKEVARAARENSELALILFDIDHFKHFNDTYGHMTGDWVLKEVARIAQSCVRDGDIVARYGGEEFAIILPRTSQELSLEVAERLRQTVEKGIAPLLSNKIEITISLGAAGFPQDARDKVGLVKAADSALYYAKTLGRNKAVPFNREIKAREEETTVIGVERVQSFLMLQIARMLANYMDVRSGTTPGHTTRMAALAAKFAVKLNLPQEEIKTFRIAALLHDIGKIALGQKLLKKSGPLSEEEREQIRLHPEIGGTLIAQFPVFHKVAAIIYQQQERYDGNGYPLGLEREDILLGARLISIVNAYFSMLTDQPFRKAKPRDEVLNELEREAGKQFDPVLVQKFTELLAEEKDDSPAQAL